MIDTDREYSYCPICGASVEIKPLFGKPRAACPACGFIHFQDPKVAVGVLIEQNGQVLLVQRNNEPQRGLWSFPAGFVDAHEDPEDAARRECLEETGLIAGNLKLLRVIGGREHARGADIIIIYRAEISGGVLSAGDDADQAQFFALSALPPLAFHATRVTLGLED